VSEPLSDQAMIEQVLQGHQEAYAMIVHRYKNKIYGILRGMGVNKEDAQDLTQETFLKAYRHLRQHHEDRSFSAWLYTISLNVWRDHLRKPSAVPIDHFDFVEPSEDMTPESQYLRRESQQEIQDKLKELPEHQRLVLLLRYTNELSYDEIADITGMSPNKVRNDLHRAKERLSRNMRQDEEAGA